MGFQAGVAIVSDSDLFAQTGEQLLRKLQLDGNTWAPIESAATDAIIAILRSRGISDDQLAACTNISDFKEPAACWVVAKIMSGMAASNPAARADALSKAAYYSNRFENLMATRVVRVTGAAEDIKVRRAWPYVVNVAENGMFPAKGSAGPTNVSTNHDIAGSDQFLNQGN
jgi:hypothetical protein